MVQWLAHPTSNQGGRRFDSHSRHICFSFKKDQSVVVHCKWLLASDYIDGFPAFFIHTHTHTQKKNIYIYIYVKLVKNKAENGQLLV